MFTHKYKASIEGSKLFMREYDVLGDMNLFKFQTFLVNDLEFTPGIMVIFRGIKIDGSVQIYGLFDFGNGSMDSVTIDSLLNDDIIQLQFVYNLDNNKYITLDYMGPSDYSPKSSYPQLVAEKGANPDQFAKKYEDLEIFSQNSSASEDDEEFFEEDSDFED